ncbi:hypothetical protein BDR07DRAFT_556472 [Suillus spraguei]|nr:hypothetical protein BDR07DRAFT_556472 [Suillus spraguei]
MVSYPSFATLHFAGGTFMISKKLWKDIPTHLDKYRGYPRIIDDTGGKNFHVTSTNQSRYETQFYKAFQKALSIKDKCSASSQLCVSSLLWSSYIQGSAPV